ncbi:MAG: formylglycine-generating enzyme family protein [Gemmataceae bacterium]|nr:formylglycine-generating enzyme family protein [Gemmataceae bacterium]
MRHLIVAGWAGLLLAATVRFLPGDPPRDKEAEKIAALVKQLGDDDFDKREAAGKALKALGDKALPALLAAVAKADELEARRRAWLLLKEMTPGKHKSKVGLELARIEPGLFRMGSPPEETNRRDDELRHRVRITRPFYLGTHEVTQEDYKTVMGKEPSWWSSTGRGKDKIGGTDTKRFPVENVTWFDAVEFCNRLSKRDGLPAYYVLADKKEEGGAIVSATVKVAGGRGYRLPTEAEWEYACRAGGEEAYHWGARSYRGVANMKPIVVSIGYGEALQWPEIGRTTKAGSYPANRFGLHDMHGNVAEWCHDWYGREYYGKSPASDPPGPDSSTQRVVRGGSWLVTDASSRVSSRRWRLILASR